MERAAPTGLESLGIEPFSYIPHRALIEQPVNLLNDGRIGVAQFPAAPGTRQYQSAGLAAAQAQMHKHSAHDTIRITEAVIIVVVPF